MRLQVCVCAALTLTLTLTLTSRTEWDVMDNNTMRLAARASSAAARAATRRTALAAGSPGSTGVPATAPTGPSGEPWLGDSASSTPGGVLAPPPAGPAWAVVRGAVRPMAAAANHRDAASRTCSSHRDTTRDRAKPRHSSCSPDVKSSAAAGKPAAAVVVVGASLAPAPAPAAVAGRAAGPRPPTLASRDGRACTPTTSTNMSSSRAVVCARGIWVGEGASANDESVCVCVVKHPHTGVPVSSSTKQALRRRAGVPGTQHCAGPARASRPRRSFRQRAAAPRPPGWRGPAPPPPCCPRTRGGPAGVGPRGGVTAHTHPATHSLLHAHTLLHVPRRLQGVRSARGALLKVRGGLGWPGAGG